MTVDTGTTSAVMKALTALVVDQALMQRVRSGGLDLANVADLATKLAPREGEPDRQLDPIEVVEFAGKLLVAHGFHRVAAYAKAGRTHIPAIVTDGDEEHLLTVAGRGNQKNGKPWPISERRLFCRSLMGEAQYQDRPWGWYEDMAGLSDSDVKAEWLALYGPGPRNVKGADGKTYTFMVAAPKPKVAAPILEAEVEDLHQSGIVDVPVPLAAPTAPPVAQHQKASAPQPYGGNGNVKPAPINMGNYGVVHHAPVAVANDPNYVKIKRPLIVSEAQAVTEFTVYTRTADGEVYEWDGKGEPPAVPGSIKSLLIAWLEALG